MSFARPRLFPVLISLLAGSTGLAGSAMAEGEVNIYSYRQPFLIQPMLDRFTAETGVRTNVVFTDQGLVERLKAEGANSPADVVLTVDISRLNELVTAKVVQPVSSPVIEANIPAATRDPQGRWFGLTTRARAIFAAKDRVPAGAVTSYADLADPRWKGRVCSRPGDHVYNIGLISAMIAHDGVDKTKAWLEGVKANLAQKPGGSDRSQVKAIKEGLCDLALVNTYYLGAMLADPEQKAWAESATMLFPDLSGHGTHVNVSGMAMTASAPNRDNALKLMEFLSGDEAQRLYAEANSEFPVKPDVARSPLVASWGTFTADPIALTEVASRAGEALKLVNEVDFNEGPGS
ncbi:iron ABC transporter substrate-binding protein [Rhodospirillum rubrum]|uniref:Fe(3+) ABC transporter substrate-binding protein n=1 Tax=Rhodospirillum rubrum TaxID=1085 RepID=UPI0019075846|nr:Fe(3+) ABC transporter substrate-binding protein [Rhodospirillum rubrum]MBK1663606.1 iron ABC transporter substrate-binding protein [Rhodospirillum rubrum]MBK1675945.1 iron ABC transporter substrate-binding protein [Rhodospirillum rubrum]